MQTMHDDARARAAGAEVIARLPIGLDSAGIVLARSEEPVLRRLIVVLRTTEMTSFLAAGGTGECAVIYCYERALHAAAALVRSAAGDGVIDHIDERMFDVLVDLATGTVLEGEPVIPVDMQTLRAYRHLYLQMLHENVMEDTLGQLEAGDLETAVVSSRRCIETLVDLALLQHGILCPSMSERLDGVERIGALRHLLTAAIDQFLVRPVLLDRAPETLRRHVEACLAFCHTNLLPAQLGIVIERGRL